MPTGPRANTARTASGCSPLTPRPNSPHCSFFGAIRPSPRRVWSRLDLFDAITTLSPETSSLSRLNRPLHLLKNLHRDLDGFWLVEYAEAEQIVDRVGALVEDS
jgi:hypothetical protein